MWERTVLVVTKHGRGVPLVDDQDAVEEFAAEAADEAFGDRVGAGCHDPARLGRLAIPEVAGSGPTSTLRTCG